MAPGGTAALTGTIANAGTASVTITSAAPVGAAVEVSSGGGQACALATDATGRVVGVADDRGSTILGPEMWSYEVETGTWTPIPQASSPKVR